jgi:hypothetical protein
MGFHENGQSVNAILRYNGYLVRDSRGTHTANMLCWLKCTIKFLDLAVFTATARL